MWDVGVVVVGIFDKKSGPGGAAQLLKRERRV
jgi:hypothetical protein